MITTQESTLELLEKQFKGEDDGHVATTCEPCLNSGVDPNWQGYTDCGVWDEGGLWEACEPTCAACLNAPPRIYCARCGAKIDDY